MKKSKIRIQQGMLAEKKKKDDESEGKQEESTEPRNQAGKTHVK